MRVIPAFDESEDGHSRFSLITETTTVEQFTFQSGKEAFTQGVIKAIPDRSRRGTYAGLFAAMSEGQ